MEYDLEEKLRLIHILWNLAEQTIEDPKTKYRVLKLLLQLQQKLYWEQELEVLQELKCPSCGADLVELCRKV